MLLWINQFFVLCKRFYSILIQVLHFSYTDAVFSGDDTTQIFCQKHDLIDYAISLMHHFIIV